MTKSTAAAIPTNTSALWVLLLGNLIIGTGVLLPAGILNDLANEFSVSSATAGYLTLIGGLVVCIGAPLVAGFTSKIDRRSLLTLSLILYGAGHLASIFVQNFTLLLIIRAVMIVGAAIFTPQAAATAGLLVPLEKRASAIAFIFIGWSSATVIGIPLGAYFSSLLGWRLVYFVMGVICLLAALLVWRTLRGGLFVTPLDRQAWKRALGNPVILSVLLVTLLSMAGQFTALSYFAPIIVGAFNGGVEQVALTFAVAGITNVIGNTIASRIVMRFGADAVIAAAIACLVLGLGFFAASFGYLIPALVGIGIFGLGSFSSNSLQQSRLVALAPTLAAATVALNTSVVYLGQAVGAYVGGILVDGSISSSIAWTACGFTSAALVLSLLITRFSDRNAAGP
jgi:MFS transporter, DHA1 family, inner membrane transport protein